MNARMGMAEKLSIPQLTKAVQDGTVPSFIGIPLIQQKMKEQQGAASMQPQQPPVAQQVLQQAMATEGVQALPSNMPQEYAQGGILHYADGGDIYDDEDYDPEDEAQAYALSQGEDLMDQLVSSPDMYEYSSGPGIESLREVKSSPSGKSFEAKEAKVQVGDGTSEKLLKHILHKESRGQRYDKEGNLLTSSKGALGEMQVMPATARDPGFGIAPARSNDPDELRRVGEEYARVLLNKYRDPKLAAIAYNMGPGNTDKWLAAGADISKLPQETRGYVQGMAGGGAVHFDGGGITDVFNMTPDEVKEYAKRKLRLEQLKSAFGSTPASAPTATPSAPSSPAAMSPFERYIKPMFGAGSLRSAAASPAGIATLGGGSLLSAGAANALSNATPEQREQLMGDIGSDTGLAAAIMNASSGPKPPAPAKPYDFTQFDAATDRYMKEREKAKAPAVQQQQAKPNVYDLEDAAAGQGADEAARAAAAMQAQGATQAAPTEQTAQANPMSGIEELLSRREAGLGKQRDIDNYMSLLSAGLGMMGGTSPFAAANIGQGAQAGIKTYGDAAARRVAEENAILSGRLGAYKYAGSRAQADAMMALRKDLQNQQLGYNRERLAQTGKEHEATLSQRKEAKQLDLIKNEQDRALATAAKLVGDNPAALSMSDTQKAEAVRKMADSLLMQNKMYRTSHVNVYGADPFAEMGGGGGGTRLKFDAQGQQIK
jgi:hypothetical protein